jgi:hypothetical protein
VAGRWWWTGSARQTGQMNPVTPLPVAGEAFLDARGGGRALRVSWHGEAGVVVLSLWSGATCRGTFRLPAEEVPDLVEALRVGLGHAYDAHRAC